jgi:hypothetical protein
MTVDRAADLLAACKALIDGPRHRWRLDRVIQCAITLHLEATREGEPYPPQIRAPQVVHLPSSPLLQPQDDFARRYPPTRTVMLDSGPMRPVDPTIETGDSA